MNVHDIELDVTAPSHVHTITFAEQDTLWVGYYLPGDVARTLALNVPGAEPPARLHLTLATSIFT